MSTAKDIADELFRKMKAMQKFEIKRDSSLDKYS